MLWRVPAPPEPAPRHPAPLCPRPPHPAHELSRCVRLIAEGMCRVIAARAARDAAGRALLVLLWGRLRRLAVRLSSVAARTAAGTPPPRRRFAPMPADTEFANPPLPPRPRVPDRLPHSLRALARLAPEAACYGSQVRALLARPEIADLLAEAPHLARYIRPLCRLLGVDPAAAGPVPSRPAARPALPHGAAAARSGPPPRPGATFAPPGPVPKPA